MDGKLLILCDELPGTYERYSIKDASFLKQEMIYPEDDPERIFVCWDSIIPEDTTFLKECMYYSSYAEEPPLDFAFHQKGAIDPKSRNIKTSIMEQSHLEQYMCNNKRIALAKEQGEDFYAEALELSVQYPLDAMTRFMKEFSKLLRNNRIVKVLPAYRIDTDKATVENRMKVLSSWITQNKFLQEGTAHAEVLLPIAYQDFGEVHKRSTEEMMKIYSMGIFETGNIDNPVQEQAIAIKNREILERLQNPAVDEKQK